MRLTGALIALGVSGACLLGGGAPEAVAVAPAAAVVAPLASVAVPGGVSGMAVQGGTIATFSVANNTVSFIDLPSLTVRSTTALSSVPKGVVLSPDGALAYLVVGYPELVYGGIDVFDTATGAVVRSATYDKQQPICVNGAMSIYAPAISPDGLRLYVLADGPACPINTEVWTIDPVTLARIGRSVTYRYNDGPGLIADGVPVSFNDRTFVMGSSYCPGEEGCGNSQSIMVITGKTDPYGLLAADNFPIRGSDRQGAALARDPGDNTLLSLTNSVKFVMFDQLPAEQSLLRIDPVSGALLGSVDGLGSDVLSLRVDPTTRLVYGSRVGGGMVVVDAVAGRVLGVLPVFVNAVLSGRGYAATASGVDVIDLGQPMAPALPQGMKVKVGSAVKGKVKATVTWKAPARSGASPVTGYRVVAQSRGSDSFEADFYGGESKAVSTQTCLTRVKLTCVLSLTQLVKTKNDRTDEFYPSLYTFTVTPINEAGAGLSGFTFVRALRVR